MAKVKVKQETELKDIIFIKSLPGSSKMDLPVVTRKIPKHRCDRCPCAYTAKHSLKRHMLFVHNIHIETVRKDLAICIQCQKSFHNINLLKEHLIQKHSLKIKEFNRRFQTLEDFRIWKKRIEKKTGTYYTQMSGPSYSKSGKKTFFHCNRSGTFNREKRTCKTDRRRISGSFKMNRHCTSKMTLFQDETNNKIQLTFCPTHYGHAKERYTGSTARASVNSNSQNRSARPPKPENN